jgi:hypothetical protein
MKVRSLEMKAYVFALPLLALVPGCVEGTESTTTYNSSGGTSTGTVIPRRDGGYVLSLSAEGQNCTAVFDDVRPGGRELSPVTCTGKGSGNATMVYSRDGTPDRVAFGGIGIGSGTLVF